MTMGTIDFYFAFGELYFTLQEHLQLRTFGKKAYAKKYAIKLQLCLKCQNFVRFQRVKKTCNKKGRRTDFSLGYMLFTYDALIFLTYRHKIWHNWRYVVSYHF